MVRKYRGQDITIGSLYVSASVDNVLARLWKKVLITLGSNFLKTVLIAIFILYVFQTIAGRHLQEIARYLADHGRDIESDKNLKLNRPQGGRWRPDALDHLEMAINTMRQDLRVSHQSLVTLNQELEGRVRERTRALEETVDLNSKILTASLAGIAVYRVSGECVFANEAIAAMVSATPDIMLQQNFHDIESWKESGLHKLAVDTLSIGTSQLSEVHLTTTFGREVWFECAFSRFMREGEAHLLLMVGDISTRKLAEFTIMAAKEEAEQANRAKSVFLSRMSHELRTPMNAILGFSQVLEMENLSKEQAGFVEEIQLAGKHLLTLINELLDLSRIEAGKLSVNIQSHALDEVVTQSMIFVESLARQTRVTIRKENFLEVYVLADEVRLQQMLVNLLSNAIKYNREGGQVTIQYRVCDDQRVCISIIDTGQGIAKENLPRLFTQFDRLGAEKTTVQGTGIGLTITEQLARLMGTHIEVESEPGKGSTFSFELRLAPQADSAAVTGAEGAATNAALDLKTCRILYIEDNPANQRLVQAVLRRYPDIELILASTGREGLSLANHHHPDVILLDIKLPDIDGYEVYRSLQADVVTQAIPVIALTANAMAQDIAQGIEAGFAHYLTKPIITDKFIQTLASVLTPQRAKQFGLY